MAQELDALEEKSPVKYGGFMGVARFQETRDMG